MSRTAEDRAERFRKMREELKEERKRGDIRLYSLRYLAAQPRTFLEIEFPNFAAELASIYRAIPSGKRRSELAPRQ